MAQASPQPGFHLGASDWQPWPGLAAEVDLLLANVPTPALVAPTGARGAGLAMGERFLVAAAVGRHLGCLHLTAQAAAGAADGLKRRREVQVLLEEGIPSPLTGRLGVLINTAGAIASTPSTLAQGDVWRLEEERLDDQEIVDLILAAAVSGWSARLTLGLGRTVTD